MHQKKAEVLTQLGDASRKVDEALRTVADVATHPDKHGWRSSLGAAVFGFPIVALSALAVDVGEVAVRRSSDAEWARAFPDENPPSADAPPANSEA